MAVADIIRASADIDEETLAVLSRSARASSLGIDVETLGLSPDSDRMEVITFGTPEAIAVVELASVVPPRVVRLLTDPGILKVLHHAVFDLSFLNRRWHVEVVGPIFCTKVAARLAGVGRNPHLFQLVKQLLGDDLDKHQQRSNWAQRPLTDAQLQYAALDVKYLDALRQELERLLDHVGRRGLFEACMTFVPYRTELALLGLDDVFAYSLPE
jgi:ribonuclease D